MKTIYEYTLHYDLYQGVTVPKGSSVLTVQARGDYLVMYCSVDMEEQMMETIGIYLYEKGEELIGTEKYITSVDTGDCIYHVFKAN